MTSDRRSIVRIWRQHQRANGSAGNHLSEYAEYADLPNSILRHERFIKNPSSFALQPAIFRPIFAVPRVLNSPLNWLASRSRRAGYPRNSASFSRRILSSTAKLPMAPSVSAQGSSVDGPSTSEPDTAQSSLLDSIFSDASPSPVKQRIVPRERLEFDIPPQRSPLEHAAVEPVGAGASRSPAFVPAAPKSLEDAGLRDTEVEDLILKFLLRRGVQSGRSIAEQLRLPFGVLQAIFQAMKTSQRIVIAKNASVSD